MPQSKPTPEIPEGVKSCSVLYKAGFKEGRESMLAELRAGGVEPVACVARSNDMEGLVQWALKRVHVGVDLFTLDQLNTALAAARVQENAGNKPPKVGLD